jgi:hypothetical protein
MQGFTIYVKRRGTGAQVVGIDTKHFPDGVSADLSGELYLEVKPYKEINKEPLWKRLRRWLLIREANLRVWIMDRRAGRGQSDIQTRTPAPVTDAAFHAPLTLSPESQSDRLNAMQSISSGLVGSRDVSTPLNESSSFTYGPDMWWKCEKCKEERFLGICTVCNHVTQF